MLIFSVISLFPGSGDNFFVFTSLVDNSASMSCHIVSYRVNILCHDECCLDRSSAGSRV